MRLTKLVGPPSASSAPRLPLPMPPHRAPPLDSRLSRGGAAAPRGGRDSTLGELKALVGRVEGGGVTGAPAGGDPAPPSALDVATLAVSAVRVRGGGGGEDPPLPPAVLGTRSMRVVGGTRELSGRGVSTATPPSRDVRGGARLPRAYSTTYGKVLYQRRDTLLAARRLVATACRWAGAVSTATE